MSEIIIIGGCIVDLVSYVPRFPKPGETLIGTKFHRAFGGKGANQCDMVAKLGVNTAMIAKVGNDSFGAEFLENFKVHGINHDHVTVEKSTHTSTAGITVTAAGENCIANVFGAIDYLTVEDVEKAAADLFPKGKLLVCTYEVPKKTLLAALKLAKKFSIKTLVNAAPLSDDHYLELLEFTDIICVNETEAGILCNMIVESVEDASKAARKLLDKVNEAVVLTLGDKGAIFCCKSNPDIIHVTSPKVRAIDTTGAGDCFNGSLAFFTIHHPDLQFEEMVRRSCIIASYSVQGEGTQLSFPYKDKLPNELFV